MAKAVEPRRLALRFSPPAIIVEYERRAQLYHRAIDLRPFLASGATVIADHEVRGIVKRISEENDPVLEAVSNRQLERLVRKLLDRSVPDTRRPTTINAAARDRPEAVALPQADYNRVSESQLRQVKERMDVVFQKNIVRPGDAGYQYDKQVSFRAAQEASEWDD
ncbi:hypothetical protein PINS_up011887 [Pythium insidiosum]|nr:hypothetical protein PINS_up011887 [Pythium insidiosum]